MVGVRAKDRMRRKEKHSSCGLHQRAFSVFNNRPFHSWKVSRGFVFELSRGMRVKKMEDEREGGTGMNKESKKKAFAKSAEEMEQITIWDGRKKGGNKSSYCNDPFLPAYDYPMTLLAAFPKRSA